MCLYGKDLYILYLSILFRNYSFGDFPEELDVGQAKVVIVQRILSCLPQLHKPNEPVATPEAVVRTHNVLAVQVLCVALINSLPRGSIITDFNGPRQQAVPSTGSDAVLTEADASRFEVELDTRVGFVP